MTNKPRFQPVDDSFEMPHPASAPDNKAAISALLLALQALSQRFVVAMSNLFTVGTVASAWVLWHDVKDAPTTLQLVWLGMYAAFVLSIEVVRRKRGL